MAIACEELIRLRFLQLTKMIRFKEIDQGLCIEDYTKRLSAQETIQVIMKGYEV